MIRHIIDHRIGPRLLSGLTQSSLYVTKYKNIMTSYLYKQYVCIMFKFRNDPLINYVGIPKSDANTHLSYSKVASSCIYLIFTGFYLLTCKSIRVFIFFPVYLIWVIVVTGHQSIWWSMLLACHCWSASFVMNIRQVPGGLEQCWPLWTLINTDIYRGDGIRNSASPDIYDLMKWKRFPHYWSFLCVIHQWPVDSTLIGPDSDNFVMFYVVSMKNLFNQQSSWVDDDQDVIEPM